MFNKSNRYVTGGIQNYIPLETQMFMWDCIDTLKEQGAILDYLEVFELTEQRVDEVSCQRIVHSQEVPQYSMTHTLLLKEIMYGKVFVIDDGEYSTMLLAEEY